MLLKTLGVVAVLTITISGAFYWYYTDSQDRIATLNANISSLESANKICEETIANMQRNQERLNNELRTINNEFATIRSQNTVLAKKLEKHDIGVLAEAKSGLVERIINNATANAFRCTELISGALLTDKEKSATSAREFNSECPWLWEKR